MIESINVTEENETNKSNINILFAATSDYVKYANVILLSILDHLSSDVHVNVCFLYADIVKEISDSERNQCFEQTRYFFSDKNVTIEFVDVSDKLSMFDNLNVGMWGKAVSLTHYMYLLAPVLLSNVDKTIYIDCDMIVNCNLQEVFNIDLKDKLIAMASPSGQEIEEDISNSGFSVLNLKQWREENILEKLISFGEQLRKSDFCDQYLLYEYFTKRYPDRLLLLDKRYNLFPAMNLDISLSDMKILHFASDNIKPWLDLNCYCRGSFLWWMYARQTAFYETFVEDYFRKTFKLKKVNPIDTRKYTLSQKIFSVTNSNDKKYKVVVILGMKMKFLRRKNDKAIK